jgi:hypothetical protein
MHSFSIAKPDFFSALSQQNGNGEKEKEKEELRVEQARTDLENFGALTKPLHLIFVHSLLIPSRRRHEHNVRHISYSLFLSGTCRDEGT